MHLDGIFVVQQACHICDVFIVGVLQQAFWGCPTLSQYAKCPSIKRSNGEMSKIFSDAPIKHIHAVEATRQGGNRAARKTQNQDLRRMQALAQQVY